MKKLIVLSAVVIGAVVAVKHLRKEEPGIQIRKIDGLELDLGLDRDIDEIVKAMDRRRNLERINHKILSGSVF